MLLNQAVSWARPITHGGDPIVFEALHPSELFKLTALYLVANFEARRKRFAGAVSDDSVRRYCRRLDLNHTLVIGAFRRHRMDAAIELHPILDNWERAEIAFIGSRYFSMAFQAALLDAAIYEARGRGCEMLYLEELAYNDAMRALLQSRCELSYGDSAIWARIDSSTALTACVLTRRS
jgi:hypothetical protein